MKKLIVFSLAVLLSSALVQAQELGIGVKGGLNFANINTSSAQGTYDGRTGYHFGAFALIKVSKIGIQPEVIFSKQGSTVKVNSQEFKANYSYINVPILLKLYTVAGINIQVGPQFGFVSSAKRDELDINGVKTTVDAKDKLKSSDISAALGLGWDLPFGLSIDARYNLGLTKINDEDGSDSAKNQVFQFSVGYKLFKIGG